MKDINEIVLTDEHFGNDLWNAVARQLEILTKAGEICVVYDDDVGIVVIQHSHRDTRSEYYGTPQPVWLDEDEQEVIDSYRQENAEGNTDTLDPDGVHTDD